MQMATNKESPTNIKALLFDLDGTLIDSSQDLASAVAFTLNELKLAKRTDREILSFVGDGMALLMKRALGSGHEHLLDEALAIYRSYYHKHLIVKTKLYDGIEELMQFLKRNRYPAGVLTNKPKEFAEPILKALNIYDTFCYTVYGDTLPVRKPDPQGVINFYKQLAIPADSLLMVGDHHTDMEAARRAGSLSLFCRYGMGVLESERCDFYADHPSEIKAILS